MNESLKPLPLRSWIEKEGFQEVAKILGVCSMTVRYWHAGHSYPTVKLMRKIKRVTKGVVGYEQIIDG